MFAISLKIEKKLWQIFFFFLFDGWLNGLIDDFIMVSSIKICTFSVALNSHNGFIIFFFFLQKSCSFWKCFESLSLNFASDGCFGSTVFHGNSNNEFSEFFLVYVVVICKSSVFFSWLEHHVLWILFQACCSRNLKDAGDFFKEKTLRFVYDSIYNIIHLNDIHFFWRHVVNNYLTFSLCF